MLKFLAPLEGGSGSEGAERVLRRHLGTWTLGSSQHSYTRRVRQERCLSLPLGKTRSRGSHVWEDRTGSPWSPLSLTPGFLVSVLSWDSAQSPCTALDSAFLTICRPGQRATREYLGEDPKQAHGHFGGQARGRQLTNSCSLPKGQLLGHWEAAEGKHRPSILFCSADRRVCAGAVMPDLFIHTRVHTHTSTHHLPIFLATW